jgi:hypothetical protein
MLGRAAAGAENQPEGGDERGARYGTEEGHEPPWSKGEANGPGALSDAGEVSTIPLITVPFDASIAGAPWRNDAVGFTITFAARNPRRFGDGRQQGGGTK